jgi:hypothetical protein
MTPIDKGLGMVIALASLGIAGCSDEPIECSVTGQARGSVITFATFARRVEDEDDLVEGVDIDGLDSTNEDGDGCFVNDFVSPDGRKGIDNQFATLIPLIEDFVGSENLDAILEGAIANGQLLIVMNVEGVDDPLNDDCVDVSIGAGTGTPFLDAEGTYVEYQTFGFDRDKAPVSKLPNSRIEDGVLLAGPADVVLPVRALDAEFNLNLHGARFRLEIEEEPLGGGFSLSGYGGGGLEVTELQSIVADLNIGDDVIDAVVPLLQNLADLANNEAKECSQVSAALRFETTPAFVDASLEMPEEEPPEEAAP